MNLAGSKQETAPLLLGDDGSPIIGSSYNTGDDDRREGFSKTRVSQPSFRRRSSAAVKLGDANVPPSAALVNLITGNSLPPDAISGAENNRPPPRNKQLPPHAPYRRRARHRSFYLNWLNEFRHWWKSSRLLVRLGGLYVTTRVNWLEAIDKSTSITGLDLGRKKGPKLGLKLVKLLGHGGPMRGFLKTVQPFTRFIRIVVAVWRWIEAAPCRRLEVGVEEATAFVGNRCSRIFSRWLVDAFLYYILFPLIHDLLRNNVLWFHRDTYNPAPVIITFGVIRAIAPYAASFQGSRIGRIFVRGVFKNGMLRWNPTQRIQELNLHSEDCHEGDEVAEDAQLIPVARQIAAALGKADHDHKIRQALETLDFEQMGCGGGGYGAYELSYHPETGGALLLHVTPYGPAICDVLPMYIIVEREESADLRKYWSQSIANIRYHDAVGPKVLEGFCYQGAYFSMHHFAEMREKYDLVMMDYAMACKKMSSRRAKGIRDEFASPPNDLQSLKRFLETGRRQRDMKKTKARMKQTDERVAKLGKKLKSMMKGRDIAPKGVILYFEGLDCAGKSSTGNLIRDALIQAGYTVDMKQYNRPPTPEQKKRPWMDRFDLPGSDRSQYTDIESSPPTDVVPAGKEHDALIWDRGPAGDFVYGALAKADNATRQARYKEFLQFDKKCREDDILFFKLFFVTDRDAIARTLGKRLAHKKINQDLHIWQDSACGGGQVFYREGLDEIDLHIDPTDFIAFNSYHDNLKKFSTFVKHTDVPSERDPDGFENPWVVVSTGKRHPARLSLIQEFVKKLDVFQEAFCASFGNKSDCCKPKISPDEDRLSNKTRRYSVMTLYSLGGFGLYWYYFANTFAEE